MSTKKDEIEKILRNIKAHTFVPSYVAPEKISIEEDIKERKENLKNKALAQDIRLKGVTLWVLFIFLLVETVAVFCFSYFQGVVYKGFHLEEWSFKLLIFATLAQITAMLQVAVRHLFPNQKK